MAFVVGVHLLMAGWSILRGRYAAPVASDAAADAHADVNLGLPRHRMFAALNDTIDTSATRIVVASTSGGAGYSFCSSVIHVGRMRVYWNLVGMIASLAAVLGDLAVALTVALPSFSRRGWPGGS